MSVLAFDFYAEDDPNGTPLGSLDDTHCKSMEFRVALTELGAGKFTVSRHLAQANDTLIRADNLVKVRIPSVGADPIFAFWLKEGDFTLISNNEEGGEDLTFGGPGVLYMLSQARLHWEVYAPDQPNRGDAPDVPFMWRWRNEPYGAMLVRGIEEGQNEPGEPLADVTINFDRFQDSNSQPWPEIVEDFQTPIGTDVLTLAERVATGGDLFLIGRPNLEVRAYQEYGNDLTGSFGSGTVRFEKGVNILTELKRDIQARLMLTHVITQDSDGDYEIHEWSGFSAGDRAHYGYLEVGQTNDPDQVEKIAAATLEASRTAGESVALEITPGFDPENGRYMPGPSTSDGHFWIGDTVTVHTGSGEHDFNEDTQRVVAIRVVLHEAADDDSEDKAARSLHIVPELNYLEIRGFGGASPGAIGQPGFCCGPNAPIPPSGSVCSRWYLTDGGGESNITEDAGWDNSSFAVGGNGLSATPTATANGQYTWAGVNEAAGEYGVGQWSKILNAAEAAAIAAGGSFRLQMRSRSRYGVGISESAQDNYATVGLRVWRSGPGIIGTAIAPGSFVGGTKFIAQSLHINRSVSGTFGAVAAVAGDVAYLEIGSHHVAPITGGTGVSMVATDTSGADLPEDESTTSSDNSWFQFCVTDAGGDQTEPIGLPGSETPGISNVYSPIDHVHAHGFLADDGIHLHDWDQLTHQLTSTQADPTVTDDSDAGYTKGWLWINTDTDEVFINVDATEGAAVWSSLTGGSYYDIPITIDGGGSVITTGEKGWIGPITTAGEIEQVTTTGTPSGSIVVDLWNDTTANFPPTVADTITASAKPTLSSAVIAQDSTLTGWDTTINSGDFIKWKVDSVTSTTYAQVTLKVRKT